METVRQIKARCRRSFKVAAKAIPSEVVAALQARASEAVASGEPHKCTGGWIASPFYGSHSVIGLLEIASAALKTEQAKIFNQTSVFDL